MWNDNWDAILTKSKLVEKKKNKKSSCCGVKNLTLNSHDDFLYFYSILESISSKKLKIKLFLKWLYSYLYKKRFCLAINKKKKWDVKRRRHRNHGVGMYLLLVYWINRFGSCSIVLCWAKFWILLSDFIGYLYFFAHSGIAIVNLMMRKFWFSIKKPNTLSATFAIRNCTRGQVSSKWGFNYVYVTSATVPVWYSQ